MQGIFNRTNVYAPKTQRLQDIVHRKSKKSTVSEHIEEGLFSVGKFENEKVDRKLLTDRN